MQLLCYTGYQLLVILTDWLNEGGWVGSISLQFFLLPLLAALAGVTAGTVAW